MVCWYRTYVRYFSPSFYLWSEYGLVVVKNQVNILVARSSQMASFFLATSFVEMKGSLSSWLSVPAIFAIEMQPPPANSGH